MHVRFRSCTVADSTQTLGTSSRASPQQNFQSWTESVPIAKSYDRNHLALFSLLENASKNRDFWLGSFSLLSTYFSILSSRSGRIRPHLAPETQNFRSIDEKIMKKLHSKSEKCNFDQVVLLRKNIIFFFFSSIRYISTSFNCKNEKSSSKQNEKCILKLY